MNVDEINIFCKGEWKAKWKLLKILKFSVDE